VTHKLAGKGAKLGPVRIEVLRLRQTYKNIKHYLDDGLGYGAWWEDLGKEQIESFLFNLPFYSGNLSSYPRPGNGAILAKVDELIGALTAKGRNARS